MRLLMLMQLYEYEQEMNDAKLREDAEFAENAVLAFRNGLG